MTIDKQELDSLPLPGHDLLGLTTVAPGVTGLGVLGSGGNGQSNDNYAATVVGNTGGDYNADGSNSDLPNAPTYGYKIPTSRKSQLTGVFKAADFAAPAFNTGEGSEGWNGYRNPGYANTDFSLIKTTPITGKATFSLRCEVFNLFNRPSLGGISSSMTSSTLARATSQYNARFLQVGGRLEF